MNKKFFLAIMPNSAGFAFLTCNSAEWSNLFLHTVFAIKKHKMGKITYCCGICIVQAVIRRSLCLCIQSIAGFIGHVFCPYVVKSNTTGQNIPGALFLGVTWDIYFVGRTSSNIQKYLKYELISSNIATEYEFFANFR